MTDLDEATWLRLLRWAYDGQVILATGRRLPLEPALWWPLFQLVVKSVTLPARQSVRTRLTVVEGLKYRRTRPAVAGPGAGVELELAYWYVTVVFDGEGHTFAGDEPGEAILKLLVFLCERGWAWPREVK